MIPYCDTPQQSMALAAVVGLIAGGIGLYTGNRQLVLAVALILAVAFEIILHEYRQDPQYVNAKQTIKKQYRNN